VSKTSRSSSTPKRALEVNVPADREDFRIYRRARTELILCIFPPD
jgi:hypothetical protein